MLRQMIAITLKELKVLLLDREALALLFIMPIFFILVMSFALKGVFEAGSKGHPIEILVVHPPDSPLADRTIADLKRLEGFVLIETHQGTRLTSEKAEELIRKGTYPLALLFPENFTENLLKNEKDFKERKATVYLLSDPAMNVQLLTTVKGTIEGILEHQAFLASLSQNSQKMAGLAPGLGGVINQLFKKAYEIKGARVELIHKFPKNYRVGRRPTATEQNVPGYTIFGVFFIVLTLASSFLKERQDGTFLRILSAPISKTTFFMGKLFPYYLVNLIQIGLMFSVGALVFGIRLGSFPAFVIVSLALAASANGLGLLVATLGRTEAQVNGLSVLLAVTLSALGGLMVPTFVMPNWMKTLSLFTPHAWALAGYHDVIIRGLGVKDILTETSILFGFASFFFGIALWRFRFNN